MPPGEEICDLERAWRFKLVAGHVGLDFVNTVDDHATETPIELLRNYTALVAWCRQAGLIGLKSAHDLAARAQRRPEHAASAWCEAIEIREAGYRLLSRRSDDPQADLAVVNRALQQRAAACRMIASDEGRTWEPVYADELGALLGPVALHLAAALSSVHPNRVRECEAPGCGWLFLDTSRSGRRRWCSMSECGNRNKARRHYERQKAAASS